MQPHPSRVRRERAAGYIIEVRGIGWELDAHGGFDVLHVASGLVPDATASVRRKVGRYMGLHGALAVQPTLQA